METVQFIEPFRRGWQRMVYILFQPFDFGRWFALGFTAWLSTLAEGGGSSFNFNGPSDFEDVLHEVDWSGVKEFLQEQLSTIILVTAIVVLVLVVISLVLLWINSRGKFMFLRNVAQNTTEIAEPWRTYKPEGNSLFLWRIGFGLVGLVVAVAVIGIGVAISWPSIQSQSFGPPALTGIIVSVLLFIVTGMVFGYIGAFLNDFVVPLMYLHRVRATMAWGYFLQLFRAYPGGFILYGLFLFALTIAAAIAVIAFGFLTCCCGFLLLAIPYIGAVAVLPITVFFRAFSLEFLGQFGEGYEVLAPMPETAPPDLSEVEVESPSN